MWPFKKKTDKPKYRRCIVRVLWDGDKEPRFELGKIIQECGPDYCEVRLNGYEYHSEVIKRTDLIWIEDNIAP